MRIQKKQWTEEKNRKTKNQKEHADVRRPLRDSKVGKDLTEKGE